jgi:hypothetical protein
MTCNKKTKIKSKIKKINCDLVKKRKKKKKGGGVYNEAVHQVFVDFKKAYDSVTRMVLF